MSGRRGRRTPAKPQPCQSADDNGRDLPGRSGEEHHDQDRRKRDPCPFPVRGKRPGHAPNRLRHDRNGNDLEAVDKPVPTGPPNAPGQDSPMR